MDSWDTQKRRYDSRSKLGKHLSSPLRLELLEQLRWKFENQIISSIGRGLLDSCAGPGQS